VAALAAAMWQEIRADRQQAEVLAAIAPLGPGRPCGGDLQEPRHAAALTTAIRYGTAASMATQRAQRAFLAHRKARQAGLLLPSPPGPLDAANENCTNELPVPPDPPACAPGSAVEPAPPRAAPDRQPRKAPAGGPAEVPEAELDDAAWLASLPAVEADPEREAERRRALMRVEPAAVRRTIGHAPLRGIEQYLAAGDPVAYEQWFARQPKPPRRVMEFLSEEDAAAVRWVTRHNPPWSAAATWATTARRCRRSCPRPGPRARTRRRRGRPSCRRRRRRRPGPGRRRRPSFWPTCGRGWRGCSTGGGKGGRTSSTWPRRSAR
jgi:hypothetical protein